MPSADRTFDFDAWSALARDDATAFERRRAACIEQAICRSSAGNRQRLRRLQWRIEMERRRARNPLQACLRLSAMMWDAVLDDAKGLQGVLAKLSRAGPASPAPTTPLAEVLPFSASRR